MIRFEQAHTRHAKLIARNMRERDIEEVRLGWDLGPEAGIMAAMAFSYFARTLYWDLKPLAIFGLSPLSVIPSRSQVWVFGTRAIDEHPIAFAKASRFCVEILFTQCALMTNMIDESDERALKWLHWLGGETIANHAYENGGRRFVQFILDGRRRACQQA